MFSLVISIKRPDVDSNHIFPLHKCTVANALMKGDALPLDYRVNNHVKKFWYLLYELFIHLIQGLYVQAKRFLLTVFTIFPPFTYLLIWNIQSYFSIIISHFLKNVCCQFNTRSRKHNKIIE